jgi:hypothetical protein
MAEYIGFEDVISGFRLGSGHRITPIRPGEVFASPADITIITPPPDPTEPGGGEVIEIIYEPRVRPLAKWRRKKSALEPVPTEPEAPPEETPEEAPQEPATPTTTLQTSLATYAGKVSGSTVENPHRFRAANVTTLYTPAQFSYEYATAEYGRITALDGNSRVASSTTAGQMAQQLFSFNIFEHVLRTYGASVFGTAATTAERVAWIRANVTRITANWHGFGSGGTGNGATTSLWTGTAWSYPATKTDAVVTKHTRAVTSGIGSYIDDSGFFHLLAHAPAAVTGIATSLTTDYIELEIETKITA